MTIYIDLLFIKYTVIIMHIYFITLLLVFYLLYVQFSPGMGNIWYRNNEYYSLMGALKMIYSPLYLHIMWYMNMWDMNFLIWILIYIIVYKLFFRFSQ